MDVEICVSCQHVSKTTKQYIFFKTAVKFFLMSCAWKILLFSSDPLKTFTFKPFSMGTLDCPPPGPPALLELKHILNCPIFTILSPLRRYLLVALYMIISIVNIFSLVYIVKQKQSQKFRGFYKKKCRGF